MDDWIKAGEIASQAREYGKKLIKIGESHLEVTKKIEAKVFELNGKLAFPTQISINNIAAHYNPLVDNDFKFKEGDVAKLDIGVHVNGAIGDTAVTVDLGNNEKLLKASKNALNVALEITKPGVKIREIGRVIHEEITSLGFSPIRNLGGHGLDRWKIHTEPSIPNFDNGDENKLKEGQIIAIEPFASSGAGLIYDGKLSEIYQVVINKNVRDINARKILKFAYEKYKTLPFARRNLPFNKLQLSVGINALKREGILHEYSTLPEKKENCLVSQHEHTVIVGKTVTTK
ncbi:type II methionyl aminopeptidase [Candidatus Woesearchaeota archaeon]|nr:type II methionyl aminopeptidase [Candidatus Woesearchaeota archaeon]